MNIIMERYPYRYVEVGTLENGEKIAVTDGEVSAVLVPSDQYIYSMNNNDGQ